MQKIKGAYEGLRDFIYDPSIPFRDRSFMVFSTTVLLALFAAVPTGLIMHEPLVATVSTFFGAMFFTLYVWFAYRHGRIRQARVFISIVLIFVFLPVMFFTNGGVYAGTPIWLLLGTIYIAMILEGRMKIIMLFVNAAVMAACWSIGYYYPETISEYSRDGNFYDSIVALFIVSAIVYILITFQNTLSRNDEEQKNLRRLFEQTATALVNAIDAKDKYTHGHSSRVAEYSRKIAEKAGKSRNECDSIYYIALLHDVGKIGIPESIINKEGKLTTEEYEAIKQHPILGAQILHDISEYPYLSIGARYHHERYDGRGYPEGLKGTDIPEYARIISVADAYDAMTSRRSYRDPIPQQQVREELVKGIGTQFDPEFARYMIHFLDMDIEYDMQEKDELSELSGRNELETGEFRSAVSDGIQLTEKMTSIVLKVAPGKKSMVRVTRPCLLLFDSLDARYHDEPREIRDLNYFEYGELFFDGISTTVGARKIRAKITRDNADIGMKKDTYRIEGLRIEDHAMVRIISAEETLEYIIALPDSCRFMYIGLTGENCRISGVRIDKAEETSPADAIPRIAEKVSFIDGPAGDIPNIEVNGYRTTSTDGIPITDGMEITFHAFSLPTARLVWHCPFIDIFTSDDGTVTGDNYHDYTLMRLDGECWEADEDCDIDLQVIKNDDFVGWENWKAYLREGFDCTVRFEIKDDKIITRTENGGISIRNISEIRGDPPVIYACLSGDQCAITNIRIRRK